MNDDRFETTGNTHLARLRDLDDLEVADGDPDVRGWSVIASDGARLGEVEDLIVDPDAKRVRYFDFESAAADRRVLLPVANTTLDHANRAVMIPASSADILGVPMCPLVVTRDFSTAYDATWTSRWGAGRPDASSSLRARDR